jgi:hypothetical protein
MDEGRSVFYLVLTSVNDSPARMSRVRLPFDSAPGREELYVMLAAWHKHCD